MLAGVAHELNKRAAHLCGELIARAGELQVLVHRRADGGCLVDLGIEAAGGLEAGRRLAEICLAGLAQVSFVPAAGDLGPGPAVQVLTDSPLAACLASQYAGWQVASGGYFAMGSGPMRAAAGKEELFQRIGCRESAEQAVGVLESRRLPPDEVCADLARQAGVAAARLTLLVAPTASLAGAVQVVARSVETALHKLLELDFDLSRVAGGFGTAPLPPVGKNDLAAVGATNDAILYGGEVTLWVHGDDQSLADIGPRVPSNASAGHGEPFARLYERAGRDFYQIDPLLFSPAVITFVNLDSGRSYRFGELRPDVLRKSRELCAG